MFVLIVVPFLDEEQFLPQLLASMAAQERLPDRLLLVDDGSSDASPGQAAAFAAAHSWASVLRRPRRPSERDRMISAHELRAFQWALDQVEEPWDVAGKLDADLRATADLVAEMVRHFEEDPRLGMAGTRLQDEDGRRQRRCPAGHVEGATSFYRRACWEAIAPLPPILGWDTIDEVRARMRGWHTESFALPAGDTVHLRPMGSHDGLLRGYRRAGLAAYAYGAHPAHVVAGAAARMRDQPRLLAGINYLAGWAFAAARRAPRAEPELRRQVRSENVARLRSLRLGGSA